ncbi:MAG TPA: alpha-L-rhamnosidase C-terminal domain-containing protein, partial [Capsulimonadaceae bacterium]|nr:alpha-L-rhamnosidase C-terminal domain-containing protein [Capsulimonadaceae bacterium]
ATTFWEAYDPYWSKIDFHGHLDADGTIGYNASLCHGWSSGPTSWLTERVLGVSPTSGGFHTATISPDLGSLKWAEGAVPTPHGPIRVRAEKLRDGEKIRIALPAGIEASVRLPGRRLLLNGHLDAHARSSNGRLEAVLDHAGAYLFTALAD